MSKQDFQHGVDGKVDLYRSGQDRRDYEDGVKTRISNEDLVYRQNHANDSGSDCSSGSSPCRPRSGWEIVKDFFKCFPGSALIALIPYVFIFCVLGDHFQSVRTFNFFVIVTALVDSLFTHPWELFQPKETRTWG